MSGDIKYRGATGAARAPKPGKAPIMGAPPRPSIFQNRGKAAALPALPGTAPLNFMQKIELHENLSNLSYYVKKN